jgi:hypothetical protein
MTQGADMKGVITHSVFFRLKYEPGSSEEKTFIDTCRRVLKPIAGVKDFRVLKEVSPKNEFAFGLTMNFPDQAAYDAYNNHPDHVNFVQGTWIPNVEEFQEIDYIET